MAVMALPDSEYGAPSLSTTEYLSVTIFMATYLLTWMGMRTELTSAIVYASTTGMRSPSPIRTTLKIMASFCNIFFVALIVFMVMLLLDMTVVEMLWWRQKGMPKQRVSAFSESTGGATRMAFSWVFNFNLLTAIALAMAMTASMCYIVLVRLSVQVVAPKPADVARNVGAVLIFNLVAVAACIVLQLLFHVQWDGVGRDAMLEARGMRGFTA